MKLLNFNPIKIILFVWVISVTSNAYAVSIDEDGCWYPATSLGLTFNQCVVSTSSWSKSTKGRLIVKVSNNCNHRVYVKACLETKNGRDDCGSEGIRPGKSTNFWASNASGAYEVEWVGSTKVGNDWVCSNKASK